MYHNKGGMARSKGGMRSKKKKRTRNTNVDAIVGGAL